MQGSHRGGRAPLLGAAHVLVGCATREKTGYHLPRGMGIPRFAPRLVAATAFFPRHFLFFFRPLVGQHEAWTLDTDGYFPADLDSDPLERQAAEFGMFKINPEFLCRKEMVSLGSPPVSTTKFKCNRREDTCIKHLFDNLSVALPKLCQDVA